MEDLLLDIAICSGLGIPYFKQDVKDNLSYSKNNFLLNYRDYVLLFFGLMGVFALTAIWMAPVIAFMVVVTEGKKAVLIVVPCAIAYWTILSYVTWRINHRWNRKKWRQDKA